MLGKLNKEQYFTKLAYKRFFFPSLTASIGMSLVIAIDSITVGSTLGMEGLAALSLTTVLLVFLDFINYSFCTGGTISYSKEVAFGNEAKGISVFNSTFFVALLLATFMSVAGIIFLDYLAIAVGGNNLSPTTLEYFKEYALILFLFLPIYILKYVLYYFVNVENPSFASMVLLAGNILAFALSFVFVILLKLGVAGAALANGVGCSFIFLVLLLHPLSKKTVMRFSLKSICLKTGMRAFYDGIPSSYSHLLNAIMIALIVSIVGKIGGTNGIAILNVIVTIRLLFDAVVESINCTIQPMLSTYLSEKNYDDCLYTLKLGIQTGLLTTLIIGILLFIFKTHIAQLLGISADAILLCEKAMLIFSVAALPMVVNDTFKNYYQVIEKTTYTAAINILKNVIFLLPFTWYFANWGIENFWFCYLATEITMLLCIFAVAYKHQTVSYLPTQTEQGIFSCTIDYQNTTDYPLFLQKAEAFVRQMQASKRQIYILNLVMEEICSAIVLNAFQGTAAKEQYLKITVFRSDENYFSIFVRDNAQEYNPFADDNRENLNIILLRKTVQSFFYRRYQGFNTLVLRVSAN